MGWIKRLAFWYAVGLIVCAWLASTTNARAHWDGDYNADGHRYMGNWGTCGGAVQQWHRTPDEVIDDLIANGAACNSAWAGAVKCSGFSFPWGFNANAGYIVVDQVAPKDCGGGTSQEPIYESHCPVGQNVNGSGTCTAAEDTPSCDSSTYPSRGWVATSNPAYFNWNDPTGSNCLWKRLTSSANGSNWNVTYEGSGWLNSDGDDWCTSSTSGSTSCAPTITIPSSPPAAAAGEEWPFAEGSGGELDGPEATCPAGFQVHTYFPDDGGGGQPASVCLVTNCQAVPVDVGVCMSSQCSSTVQYTGETCDGSEEVSQGDVFTDAGGAAGTAETTAILTRIYQRIGTGQVLDAAASVAEIAAIGAAADQISDAISESGGGGGGECTEGSCDGELATLGEGTPVATQVGDFMGRIQNAPIVEAFAGFGGDIPEAACPSFSSDPIALLEGDTLTITAACDLWDDVAPILGLIMMVVYIGAGIFIILRA